MIGVHVDLLVQESSPSKSPQDLKVLSRDFGFQLPLELCPKHAVNNGQQHYSESTIERHTGKRSTDMYSDENPAITPAVDLSEITTMPMLAVRFSLNHYGRGL